MDKSLNARDLRSALQSLQNELTEDNTDPVIDRLDELSLTGHEDAWEDQVQTAENAHELQEVNSYCDEMDNCRMDAERAGEDGNASFYTDLIQTEEASGLKTVTPYTEPSVKYNVKEAVGNVLDDLLEAVPHLEDLKKS